MNVFEVALKMELDGERYYKEQASKVNDENLQSVLLRLADDEFAHYRIVQALQHYIFNDYTKEDPALKSPPNVFESAEHKAFIARNADSIVKLKDEEIDFYRAALIKEEESIQFYKKMQEESKQSAEKEVLAKLVHEEEKHAEVLDNIVQMFNRANEWVEVAEFNHKEPYWRTKRRGGKTMPAVRISPEELKQKMEKEKFIILDLRQDDAYDGSQEQIKGSIRLDPNDDAAIQRMMDNTDKNAAIVGYCTWHNEYTSARVANIFNKNGFHNVRALKGGMQGFKDAGYPMEPKK